jgi:ketosteroid isomerase-like protein
MSEDNAKLAIRDFLAAFSRGDVEAVLAMMGEDATWWVSGKIEGLSGSYSKAEFGPLMAGAAALYRERALAITPSSMIAEGDKVAVEASGFATMADGRAYSPAYHFLFEVAGGKILRVKEYMDTAHARDIFFGSPA